jgi:peptidoglycan-associated lipoprotein
MPQTSAPPLEQGPTPRAVELPPTYRGPWEDPSNPLYNRIVYFDYDSSAIKPDYIGVMRNHAAYLGANSGTRVTLDGNTDERGTREYNLALGDQRAEAVRKFMVAEGVKPDQIATLSYGEERPANPGHTDSAWAQNRRVVIQY